MENLSQYLLPNSNNSESANVIHFSPSDENVEKLLMDLNNIRQTQMQYGMPAIGDLFKSRPQDIQDTINSVYYMLRQRIEDIENKKDHRQKAKRAESQNQDAQIQLDRQKSKIDQLTRDLTDLRNQIKNVEAKHKLEISKITAERDELIKSVTKIEHKETQYRHEIKSKELQISKLKELLQAKNFDKKAQGIEQSDRILASNEVRFHSAENDLNSMITKSHEEIQVKSSQENQQIKNLLKSLQNEMFDIIKLKSDIYKQRLKVENSDAICSEEILNHQLEKIKEGIIDLPFEQRGQDIISKFKSNFYKLKQFLENIDQSMNDLQIQETQSGDITQVNQMKELFRNYEGVIVSQQKLLHQGIQRLGERPSADVLETNLQNLQAIKEEEIEDMRSFMKENLSILENNQKELDHEKKQYQIMNTRMDEEKHKIIQDREKMELKLLGIRQLNKELFIQNGL